MNRVSVSSALPLAPMLLSAKIQPTHQELLALVYVRQSSTKQVEENIESTEMQYLLLGVLITFAWGIMSHAEVLKKWAKKAADSIPREDWGGTTTFSTLVVVLPVLLGVAWRINVWTNPWGSFLVGGVFILIIPFNLVSIRKS